MLVHRRIIIALCTLGPAVAMAACGGSGPQRGQASSPQTQVTPSSAQASTGTSRSSRDGAGRTARRSESWSVRAARRHGHIKPLPGAIHRGNRPVKARAPGDGKHSREPGGTAEKPFNPCTLVSRAEARTILGTRVRAPMTASQGPTCIYRRRHGGPGVTLAVESQSLQRIVGHSRSLARVRVHGHAGRCVKYGSVMMYVPLAGGRVLNVTAACPIAARFAAKALPRLLG